MDLVSIFTIAAAGVVGAVVGSFLNVVIIRGERNESLMGRSYCDSCHQKLSASELIPIISFIIQKGRCRQCSTALFWQYPLVELAALLGYAGAAWLLLQKFPWGGEFLFFLIASFLGIGALLVIFVSDLKYYLIPNGAVLTLLILGGLALFLRHGDLSFSALVPDLGSTAILSAFLASLWFLSKGRWMGLGDGKLFFAISLLVGFPLNISAFIFSFWLGALTGGGLLLAGKKHLGELIPFGPFIILGGASAILWGEFFFRLTGLYLFF